MGWMGWTYQDSLDTPVPMIVLAIEGKVDFVQKTNPFGSGKKKTKAQTPEEMKDFLRAFVPPNR